MSHAILGNRAAKNGFLLIYSSMANALAGEASATMSFSGAAKNFTLLLVSLFRFVRCSIMIIPELKNSWCTMKSFGLKSLSLAEYSSKKSKATALGFFFASHLAPSKVRYGESFQYSSEHF